MGSSLQRAKRLLKAQTHMTTRAEMRLAEVSTKLKSLEDREKAARDATERSTIASVFSDFHVRFFHSLAEQQAQSKEQLNTARIDLHREQLRLAKLTSGVVDERRSQDQNAEQDSLIEAVAIRSPLR